MSSLSHANEHGSLIAGPKNKSNDLSGGIQKQLQQHIRALHLHASAVDTSFLLFSTQEAQAVCKSGLLCPVTNVIFHSHLL